MGLPRTTRLSLSGLRRITSDGRFIPEIDGFRLLAIMLVVVDHIHGQIATALNIPWPSALSFADGGRRGVEFFFVISGFILGLPFARRALSTDGGHHKAFSYRAYLLRRLTRLEPPYVLSLLLRLALILMVFHEAWQELAPHFFASLFYVHNLIFGTMSRISPPTWSLEVEVQFYLLAPLLAAVFKIPRANLRRAVLLAATLIPAILFQLYLKDRERVALSLLGNVQYFAAGFLLCECYFAARVSEGARYVLDAVAIALLFPLLFGGGPLIEMLFPFGALLVYIGGLRGAWLPRLFALPLVSVAGGMCYSIYLTHGTILAALASMLRRLPLSSLPVLAQQLVLLGICLATVFAIGTLYFVLIERPCMDPNWPSKLRALLRFDRSLGIQSP